MLYTAAVIVWSVASLLFKNAPKSMPLSALTEAGTCAKKLLMPLATVASLVLELITISEVRANGWATNRVNSGKISNVCERMAASLNSDKACALNFMLAAWAAPMSSIRLDCGQSARAYKMK